MAIKKVPQKTDRSIDNRQIVRADSRPRGHMTCFTCRGDSLTAIGDGTTMAWDFSNADNIVTDSITKPIPANHKRKRLEIGFSEKIYIKEGTLYFHNAPKGQYLDFWVICKTGGVYDDPNGTIPGSAIGLDPDRMYTQAQTDTVVTHYVNQQYMQGSCPMGDELNTEGASEAGLPTQMSKYVLWCEITTPTTDITSNGYASIELYRPRSVLLPNEDLE